MADPTETARRVLDLDKQATQGPWRILRDPDALLHVLDATTKPGYGCAIATDVCDPDGRVNQPNAALIAEYRTAAPELARALIESQAALAAANARADAAEGALVKHQTEPDQADPDGWIRRSALNKWAAAAQDYRADLARVTAERDDLAKRAAESAKERR